MEPGRPQITYQKNLQFNTSSPNVGQIIFRSTHEKNQRNKYKIKEQHGANTLRSRSSLTTNKDTSQPTQI